MEPMNLGSPPSSPSSPGANPNFLPPFLLGEQPSTPIRGGVSPNLNRSTSSQRYALSTTTTTPSEPKDLRQKLFNQSVAEMGYHSPYSAHHVERQGPPKQGLFDAIENKKLGSSALEGSMTEESFSRANDSLNDSARSETLWVTIFGFPPSALNLVLSHFANVCVIVDKKIPGQGNWVHLKLGSISDVRKALTFNGKCISNSIMIGVTPYNNITGNKENLDSSLLNQTSRARSLRRTAVSPIPVNAVTPPQNVPQKSTGLVTKAMEYVFGW